MSAEPIDYDDIKWGSLTKQLQAFNRKNRTNMDLESFSKHILANPKKFIERSKDRARFYLNVIKPRAKKGGALSSHVMSDLLAQSYETKNKKKRRTEIDGFHIDPSLSGERAQVWYNPTTKQAVVVHRGTASFQDVMTDARLFFGDKSGKRFRHADNIQKKAEAKYGKAHVSTLGHSLGSQLAEKVGQRSKEVLTLNKPTTLEDLAKGKKVSEKQTDVRTKYDPVSILRPYQKGSDAIEIESTTWNPLAEHKTDTLKRLDEDVMIGRGKLGMMMRGAGTSSSRVIPTATERQAPSPEQAQIMSDILSGFPRRDREAILRTFNEEVDAPIFEQQGGFDAVLDILGENPTREDFQQAIRLVGTTPIIEAEYEDAPIQLRGQEVVGDANLVDRFWLPSAREVPITEGERQISQTQPQPQPQELDDDVSSAGEDYSDNMSEPSVVSWEADDPNDFSDWEA